MAGPLTPADVFPAVVPNADLTTYEGPLTLSQPVTCTGGVPLWIRLHSLPKGSATLRGAVLHCSPGLAHALAGQEQVVKQRLDDSQSVAAFFTELRALLERQAVSAAPLRLPSLDFYSAILMDCQDLGWNAIQYLADDMLSLTLLLRDSREREHMVHCRLSRDYPQSCPLTEADLPAQPEVPWLPGECSLSAVHRAYAMAVEGWQELWACLEDLDEHCWVMEPEQPRRSDLFRRLSLGGFCSLRVSLEGCLGTATGGGGIATTAVLPEVQFLGADSVVAPLRERWAQLAASLWNPGELTRSNIEKVLGQELPSRSTAEEHAEEHAGACGICYSYFELGDDGKADIAGREGGGEGPDVNCNNPPCGRPYHRRCLVEWLRSVSNTRQSFDMIFGHCVYCSAALSVKATDTTR